MARVLTTTASAAVVALVATFGMSAPGFASTKSASAHHSKQAMSKHGMRLSRAHGVGRGRMAMAAPAAPTGNGDFFGSGGLFGGVNGTGATGGGSIDPANAKSAGLLGGGLIGGDVLGGNGGLLGGGGLLGTGVGGGNGVLGTGVLDGQGAVGLGILGL